MGSQETYGGGSGGAETLGDRVSRSPLARIVVGIGIVLGATLGSVVALQPVFLRLVGPDPSVGTQRLASTAGPVLLAAVVFGSYLLYSRLVDGRWPDDLRRGTAGRDLVGGTGLGAGLFSLALAAVWLAGGYRVTTVNPLVVVLPAVTGVVFFVGLEEVLNRGILLPELEARLGTWVAVVASSFVFAGYHAVLTADPTPVALGVIFAASVLLAGAYLLTRSLWLPVAIHAGWNFTQGAVFGIQVSGNDAGPVAYLAGETAGPTWLTGGAYGLEGSLVTLSVVTVAAAVPVWLVYRRGLAVPRSRA
jgi:hypothetical protein